MELNYLNDFVTLARIRHFQEAADALFISQPTLSKHIKAIESELGQDLFIRSRKRSELTEFGKSFLPYARKILDIQQEYTLLLSRPASDGCVSFGCIPMVTLYNFTQFLASFLQKDPTYRYDVVQNGPPQLMTLLRQKAVEFILTSDIPGLPEEDYGKVLYTKDQLMAIVPRDHKLASRDRICIEDLEGESLITFSSTANTEDYLQKLYPQTTFRTQISVEKVDLLCGLVQHGFGISIMTYWNTQKITTNNVVVKNIYPACDLEIYMIYEKARNLSPLTKSLISYLNTRNQGQPPDP